MQHKADERSASTDMCSQRTRIESLGAQVDHLRSQVEEAQRREQLLSSITRYLVPGSSPGRMLSNVLSLVVPYTGADTGSVLLLSDHGQIVSQISQQAQPSKGERSSQCVPQQALNNGLIAWVIKNAQTTIVADTRTDGRWTEQPTDGSDARSALALPLRRGHRVHGVILLAHSQPSHFDESHLSALSYVADQVATAIENARLYKDAEQRTVHLRLVNMVSHEIGAVLDIDLLLWEVIRRILETLDCYHVAIALIEENELVFKSGIDHLYRPMVPVRLSLSGGGEGIPGQVVHLGHSILVPDVLQDERYQPFMELSDTRSELAVPLQVPVRTQNGLGGGSATTVGHSPTSKEPALSGDQGSMSKGNRIIGVLDVRSTEVGAFSMDDQDLLEALAAQVAVAIENARLFGRVRGERATLEAILTGTEDVIIVTDPADRILLLNPAASQVFLDGENPQPGSLLAQVVKNEVLLGLWNHVTDKESCSNEVPLPDGRTLYASLTLIPNVGKVAVMQDISRLKELDQIKSEFVSTVSHDLRSPLQAIQTSAELLPRLGELTREQNREVIHIQAIVRRMSKLVQDLLDIGRIEAGIGMETEACAIDEIIASAAGSCKGLAIEKGLDFVIDLPRTLPLVQGNSLRLDQVVSNLVNNAIKFTPEGSVTVRAKATDGHVLMEVIDTGIGIPLEAQDKLFQKFYRVKSPETRGIRGTGLGLAIVKSIVETYGGQIELESFPRLGSTFRVAFPICEDEPA